MDSGETRTSAFITEVRQPSASLTQRVGGASELPPSGAGPSFPVCPHFGSDKLGLA